MRPDYVNHVLLIFWGDFVPIWNKRDVNVMGTIFFYFLTMYVMVLPTAECYHLCLVPSTYLDF